MICFHGTITSSLGRFRKVFTVEMEQEFAKDARFDELIGNEFTQMAFEFSDLLVNDLSHTLNKGKKPARKEWVRDFC
jgi:hypothetical protein